LERKNRKVSPLRGKSLSRSKQTAYYEKIEKSFRRQVEEAAWIKMVLEKKTFNWPIQGNVGNEREEKNL